MNEKLAQALNAVRDRYIADAAGAKKHHRRALLGAAAAVLAMVICFQLGSMPLTVRAQIICTPSEPRQNKRPDLNDYKDRDAWNADYDAWLAQREAQDALVGSTLESLSPFLTASCKEFLSGSEGKNQVWSPVNGYIALAMLAETTGGETRQQILDLLEADSLELLRDQVGAVWESVYRDDSKEISVLANSLWLDSSLSYEQEAMDNLAYYHYASVYQGTFGSAKTDKALQAWVNSNTGGLLKESVSSITLPSETVLALASAVYFQSKWSTAFSAGQNTQDLFHAPGGDMTCTYMNRKEAQMYYYWGNSFGAVALGLKNGSRMWLILPDEDKTTADVLSEGQYLEMVADANAYADSNGKYMKVNLSMPKFDVCSSGDLKTGLQKLGITRIFDMKTADFSPSLGDSVPAFVSSVNQAARVTVDEEGVKAASYIEMPTAGAAAPPEEIIDFTLDRPFLFVIASYSGLPLFAGVVNQP